MHKLTWFFFNVPYDLLYQVWLHLGKAIFRLCIPFAGSHHMYKKKTKKKQEKKKTHSTKCFSFAKPSIWSPLDRIQLTLMQRAVNGSFYCTIKVVMLLNIRELTVFCYFYIYEVTKIKKKTTYKRSIFGAVLKSSLQLLPKESFRDCLCLILQEKTKIYFDGTTKNCKYKMLRIQTRIKMDPLVWILSSLLWHTIDHVINIQKSIKISTSSTITAWLLEKGTILLNSTSN